MTYRYSREFKFDNCSRIVLYGRTPNLLTHSNFWDLRRHRMIMNTLYKAYCSKVIVHRINNVLKPRMKIIATSYIAPEPKSYAMSLTATDFYAQTVLPLFRNGAHNTLAPTYQCTDVILGNHNSVPSLTTITITTTSTLSSTHHHH